MSSATQSEFPSTLKGFGYAFNDAGQLRQIDPEDETKTTDKPYKFDVYPSAAVWDQSIAPVYDTIEAFAVVAHSYGGVVTLRMADDHSDEFKEKCFGIGFTDSVHYSGGLSQNMRQWFNEHARNFVTSSKPLNTKLDDSDIPSFSAGHTKHEWTSWACIDALFPYLEDKYKTFLDSKSTSENVKGDL